MPPEVKRRWGLWLLYAATVAIGIPLVMARGWSLEDTAGAVSVPLAWQFPEEKPNATRIVELGSDVRLYESDLLPVWGVGVGEHFFPLLADGHVGALPFYPLRFMRQMSGPTTARMVWLFLGSLTSLVFFVIGERIFGTFAGWLTGVLVATSPLFVSVNTWARPDEHWLFLLPGLALVAMFRFVDTDRERWLWASASFAGWGVASKTTAVWTIIAIALAALIFRLAPRLTRRQWAIAGCLAAVPLLPQFAYILFANGQTLGARFSQMPWPWKAFAPDRLAFFVQHYVDTLSQFGEYTGEMGNTNFEGYSGGIGLAGVVLLTGTTVMLVLFVLKQAPTPVRAFSLGLSILLGQYVTFYYVGESMFFLVIPWALLALAGAAVYGFESAGHWRTPKLMLLVRALIVASMLIFLASQIRQLVIMERIVASTNTAAVDLRSQMKLSDELQERGILQPWTMTYTLAGVLETLSNDKVRPFHAYPILVNRISNRDVEQLEMFAGKWEEVFARQGNGLHHIILIPRAVKPEVSPAESGAIIVSGFYRAAARHDIPVQEIFATHANDGSETFRVVSVELTGQIPPDSRAQQIVSVP